MSVPRRVLWGFVVLVGVGFALPASATRVRVNTMGGGEKRLTFDDETVVSLLPSLLVDYPDRALIDVIEATSANTSFGAHFALSARDVVAIYGGSRTRAIAGGVMGTSPALAIEFPGSIATRPGAVGGVVTSDPGPRAVLGSLGGVAAAREAGQDLEYTIRLANPVAGLGGATSGGSSLGSLGGLGGLGGLSDALTADLHAAALYAHRFDSWRLGLLVGVWADLEEQTSPEEQSMEQRATFVELRLGAGVDIGDQSGLDLALVGGFATFRDEAWDPAAGSLAPRYESDGLWQLGLTGRAKLALFHGGYLVPYCELTYRSETVQGAGATGDDTLSFWGLNGAFGVDVALEPIEGVIVQPGVGFTVQMGTFEGPGAIEGADDKAESLILAMPFYGVAVEAWVLDWLALRLSAKQRIRYHRDQTTIAGAKTKKERYEVDTEVALGVGFRFVGFELDFLINPDILTHGPYGLTGTETDTLNLQVALRYAW